jgi:SAM-dependent methyltransferase/methyltransferase-like protein
MSSSEQDRFIYDEVSYPELCYGLTHPGRTAAIATILGMQPAPVEACRVLEIGCASGGNLIPMAHGLPGSSFVGMDLSARQIDRATELAGSLGLQNVRFLHADLSEPGLEAGEFDFIIAHGVYSWVPAPVQDKLLEACKRLLARSGVAYISYNTLPGWSSILNVREIINFHTRHLSDPRERVRVGRDFLSSLLPMLPEADNSAFTVFLRDYIATRFRRFADRRDWEESMLLHDELSEVNAPVYFHQFAAHAARHGLGYLAEADFPRVMPNELAAEDAATLQQSSKSIIEFEQYLDFVRDQTFRSTLLVHDDTRIGRQLDGNRVRQLYVSSRARFVRDDDGNECFRTAEGARWPAEEAITSAAMLHLEAVAPRAIRFPDLLEAACRSLNLNGTPEKAATVLADDLLAAFAVDTQLVEFLAWSPPVAPHAGEHPRMSEVARQQAKESLTVSTLLHEQAQLDPTARALAALLDGNHDRPALLQALSSYKESLPFAGDDASSLTSAPPGAEGGLPEQTLEYSLARLANAGLLCL